MKYWKLAKEVLRNLAKEYQMPLPSLRIGDSDEMDNYAGLYNDFPVEEILIAKYILKDPVETCKTIRHEFAHYWQHCVGLPSRERSARRFENPSKTLDLPNNQKTLVTWCNGSQKT